MEADKLRSAVQRFGVPGGGTGSPAVVAFGSSLGQVRVVFPSFDFVGQHGGQCGNIVGYLRLAWAILGAAWGEELPRHPPDGCAC